MDNDFYISKSNWNKIINYAGIAYDEFKAEIGGMSVVVEDKEGDWEIKDPVILKQVITATNTHLDKDELAIYYTNAAKKYKNKNFRFCWWHSHHTMGAFWSGTDTDTIDEFNEGDFSFALVVNLKEEYKFRVSVWKPFEIHKDVEICIMENEKKFPKKLVNEVNELCSKPAPTTTMPRWNYNKIKNMKNQTTIWRQPIDLDSLIEDEPEIYDYTKAYQLMQNLINGACAGTVKYKDYVDAIKEFNDKATEQDTGVLIGRLDMKSWEDSLMTSTPSNHIIDTDDTLGYHSRWGI